MGKRRNNLEHRTKYDTDEESDEEVIEETHLNEEQQSGIKPPRKKLVAKRRVGPGVESSLSAPSPFTLITKSSTDEKTGPSVFSGFKGFTAFQPTSSVTSATSTAPTEESRPSQSESWKLNGAKPESKVDSGFFAKQDTESDKKGNLPKNKNISEIELKFITELNDLYERCYGANKRSYKLPIEVLNESDESSDQETKYACLLAELNRHISKWISKHVEESPLVLLTPVFVDYFNYLILLEKDFFPGSFKKNEKASDAIDKLTNGTKLPMNGTNGHKDSTEKPDIIIKDTAKENKDIVDSSKKTSIFFKSTNQPLTPICFDTNTKETFKFGSVSSSEEEKNSLFKKSTIETKIIAESKELETTPSLPTQIHLPKITTSFEAAEKVDEQQNTEANQSKTLFSQFAGNVSNTASLFKFSSTMAPESESALPKIDESIEKKEEKTPEQESKKFSFAPAAGGFFSSLKKNEEESTEKKEEKKAEEGSKKFTFGQAQGGIFSSLKKSEEKLEEEKSSDSSSFQYLKTTPFTFKTASSTVSSAPKDFFSFGSSDKTSIFSSTPLGGDTKSIFGTTPSPFGTGITFGTGTPVAGGDAEGEEEPYEPPKPESSNVKEEGSVYEKRMKLYYFNEKEKKFVDRGIGNLFIKPTKDGESTQLVIRADTTLANILLNVKLSKVFPISKIGHKDVSYVCVPNPEIPGVSNTSPCKFLFKVKAPEDADELLEKLNEFKK
ncbi:nuclear pore complex Nup50 [Brachionus plicatilis]|uniref:Nuclear pore complex Nup50 n=1 Tax=Brachionus plicatilis TaxID=10195 RepID=A0A3M7SZ38_BRAPC|nr:nuclear pore complex Nup50 [Brachionus plicatilis]